MTRNACVGKVANAVAGYFPECSGSIMKIFSAEFIKSCLGPEHFPTGSLPEIAFVGRSNVGKSSLINSLLNRRDWRRSAARLARHERSIFSGLHLTIRRLTQFMLVDLPGYGFAKVSKSERAQWAPLIESYLRRRRALLESFCWWRAGS